jgi:hypothetical protein
MKTAMKMCMVALSSMLLFAPTYAITPAFMEVDEIASLKAQLATLKQENAVLAQGVLDAFFSAPCLNHSMYFETTYPNLKWLGTNLVPSRHCRFVFSLLDLGPQIFLEDCSDF